MDYNIS